MLIVKVLGAVLLASVGGCGALWLNRNAEAAVERLDAWISLARLTKNQIDCFSLPLPEILQRCEPSLLLRLGTAECTPFPPKEFPELLTGLSHAALTEEGERTARLFCEEIGKGYRAEQLRTCDHCIGLFCAERDRLLSELPRRRKRNITLCLSAALGTVVLLI